MEIGLLLRILKPLIIMRQLRRFGTEITKFELYDKNQLLKTYNSAEINDDISLEPGVHHLTSRAYNSNGEKTQSTTAIVYVVGTAEPGSFSYTQIGKNCSFNNLASSNYG